MTSTKAPGEPAAPQGQGDVTWTLRALIARHRRFSIGALAILVLMLGTLVAASIGPGAGAVSDSTACSGWGSANQARQAAYAVLYVKEHGALRSGATDPASVEAAINKGCMQAFDADVADTVNVYQAINNQY